MAVSKKINLSRLSYVTYSHPDLKKFLQFADDFGFQSAGQSDDGAVYLRGYGIDPYLYIAHQSQPGEPKTFHGAGFVAKTEADFNRACQMEGAQLVDISHRPGGGKMVRIMDPNGYPLEVVHGQTEREIVDKGITNVIGGQPNVNTAVTKPRQGTHTDSLFPYPGVSLGYKNLDRFTNCNDDQANSIAWIVAQR